MSEIEVPLEQLQENIQHHAQHSHGSGNPELMMRGAFISAILAVCAAVSALMAGHQANEAMIEQIQASNDWAYYQAKGIKASIAELKTGGEAKDAEAAKQKVNEYKQQQEEIKHQAEEKQTASKEHLHRHETLASSVTFFQVAIALTAISVLTRRKRFLHFSLILGIVGVALFTKGWLFI
jgi:hypothetical protein